MRRKSSMWLLIFDNFFGNWCIRAKLLLVHMSTILSSVRKSAWLPQLTKKSICRRTEAPQKHLRPWHKHRSIRRGKSGFSWSSDVWTIFINLFWKIGQNRSHKIGPSKSGVSLPRALQWLSQICRSPCVLLASWFFVCLYYGSNPAVVPKKKENTIHHVITICIYPGRSHW